MSLKLNKNLSNFCNYKGVIFEDYIAELDNNKIICRPIIKHDANIKIIDNVDGIEILLSLCNLYNKYTYKEIDDGDYLELGIKDWCTNHIHPINNNDLTRTIELFEFKKENLSKRKLKADNRELHKEIEKYTKFNLEAFKNLLEKLTINFNIWYALDMACNHNNIDLL